MDAGQVRKFAETKLIEGNISAATKYARQYLQLRGDDAPVVTHPLLALDQAVQAEGVRGIETFVDSEVASTAQLINGIPQFAHWTAPYRPPALRLLALERCVALAPSMLLTSTGLLLDDNIGFSNSELCEHMPKGFPGIAASGRHIAVAVRHRDTARVKQPAIYLPAPANYAEWFFGSLPRLAACAKLDELPIVLHGDPTAYQLASLTMLGIGESRILSYRADVRLECQELYYCTTSYSHHAVSVTGLNYLRTRIPPVQDEPSKDSPHRLYLARRKVKDRPILNEEEVIQLFERHDFVAIDPEQHTFEEQVRFASSAEMIAGPYGANLTNIIFARHARKCVILATKQQPEFARLVSALGIAFWHALATPVKLREGRTISESYGFNIDLANLKAALSACA